MSATSAEIIPFPKRARLPGAPVTPLVSGVTAAQVLALLLPLLRTDADFLVAEREIEALRAESDDACADDLNFDPHEIIWDRIWKLDNVIARAEPRGIQSVAVKLRRLLDPEMGMEKCDKESDFPSLRQMLAFVERAADKLKS
jgi:hypothetical protein